MFRQTLIATLTTAALATGSLGVASVPASAASLSIEVGGFGGPAYRHHGPRYRDHGPRFRHHHRGPRFGRHKICRPVYRERTVWTRWGPRKTMVKVAENCHWARR